MKKGQDCDLQFSSCPFFFSWETSLHWLFQRQMEDYLLSCSGKLNVIKSDRSKAKLPTSQSMTWAKKKRWQMFNCSQSRLTPRQIANPGLWYITETSETRIEWEWSCKHIWRISSLWMITSHLVSEGQSCAPKDSLSKTSALALVPGEFRSWRRHQINNRINCYLQNPGVG